jgi:hypothetical protein
MKIEEKLIPHKFIIKDSKYHQRELLKYMTTVSYQTITELNEQKKKNRKPCGWSIPVHINKLSLVKK